MKRFVPAAGAITAAFFVAGATEAGAPAGRYRALAPGVVYDTMTKLSWQQVPAGGSPDGGAPTQYTWPGAFNACQTLNLDGQGWRLPTEPELLTLVDWTAQFPPLIDGTYFPNTPADVFWSSTPPAGTSGVAWTVTFGAPLLTTNYYATTSLFYVRCVR